MDKNTKFSNVRKWAYWNQSGDNIPSLLLLMYTCALTTLWITVDCLWGPWSNWASCTVTCGGGLKERQRAKKVQTEHDGIDCAGSSIDTAACMENPCPGAICVIYTLQITMVATCDFFYIHNCFKLLTLRCCIVVHIILHELIIMLDFNQWRCVEVFVMFNLFVILE